MINYLPRPSAAKFLEIISHQGVWDIFLHFVLSRTGALVPNLYHDVQKTHVFLPIFAKENRMNED